MASTQFESLDARRALPCWDEPARKATFGVTMVIPAHLTALSNMPEVESAHIANSGGRKRVTFGTSPVMSTYLLAWALGEFDAVAATTKVFICLFFVLIIFVFVKLIIICMYLCVYIYVYI
jgi:aminopeptidase N